MTRAEWERSVRFPEHGHEPLACAAALRIPRLGRIPPGFGLDAPGEALEPLGADAYAFGGNEVTTGEPPALPRHRQIMPVVDGALISLVLSAPKCDISRSLILK